MLYWLFVLCSLCTTVACAVGFGWYDRLYEYGLMLLTFVGTFVACLLLFLIVAVIVSLFVNKNKPVTRRNPVFYAMTMAFLKLFLRFAGIRFHVKGMEKLPEDGVFLWVGNHRTIFDPMIAMVVFSRRWLAFVSKKENMSIPFGGSYIHAYGCLGLDRENLRSAAQTARDTAEILKSGNRCMGIYPEGGSNRTEEPLIPFKEGAISIARRAGVPIVVCVMRGLRQIPQNKFRRISHIEVEILETVSAEEVLSVRTPEMTRRIYDTMYEALKDECPHRTERPEVPASEAPLSDAPAAPVPPRASEADSDTPTPTEQNA